MRRVLRAFAHPTVILLLATIATGAYAGDELAVEVVNASEPTLCAEKDNVHLKLGSPDVRRFTIEAVHPAYMGTIVVDRYAPDFRNCDMSNDPVHKAEPRRITLYETNEWQLVGLAFPSYWRAAKVPVRVGERVETGLHLLQLWTRFQERAEEVLVLYPPDGYWRARPLPPAHLRWSAYGSSFLVGPEDMAGRPLVDIKDIAFDPATRTFHLAFVRGGSASLRLQSLDQDHIALDVTFDSAISGAPFAALRSMFVTEVNADVARVGWRTKGAQAWQQAPVMTFARADAVELWAGRALPSRHNLSAPDMVFRDFRAAR
ncbi:MAG TPA: hypothetical protein VKE26_08430 [Xanthobacteraceae bacterium]|nr:hypothetical protein [Xanthobacteraceae bacterium]